MNSVEDPHPSEITFDRKSLRAAAAIFCLLLVAVPLIRHVLEWKKPREDRWLPLVELWNHPSQRAYNSLFEIKQKNPRITREAPNLRDHFAAFETGLKKAPFADWIRRGDQEFLHRCFNQGNSQVFGGKNGWLYYQPALDAITGLGALRPEPDTVTKDPNRPDWIAPFPVISHFARQLQERGIRLAIVPIPVKPMIENEGLGLSRPVKHPDQNRFYQLLRQDGIEVIDLFELLSEKRFQNGKEVFLRTDTHWTNETVQEAARATAAKIAEEPWFREWPRPLRCRFETTNRTARGDLVRMLGLDQKGSAYGNEVQDLDRVVDDATGHPLQDDLFSPVSVLGDSFVNIYEEPGLGFGSPDDEGQLIGAGFASHLAAALGIRLHVVAINGGGSTEVRRAFAALPDNVVRSRKLVVWVLASRDLFLAESAAARAGVYWRDVEFNQQRESLESLSDSASPAQGPLILTGVLRKKSAIPDPQKSPYADAIYATVFDSIEVESGEYYDEEAYVFLWAFRDKTRLPGANLEVGKKYRLILNSLSANPVIAQKRQLDDFRRTDIDPFFAIEAREKKK